MVTTSSAECTCQFKITNIYATYGLIILPMFS